MTNRIEIQSKKALVVALLLPLLFIPRALVRAATNTAAAPSPDYSDGSLDQKRSLLEPKLANRLSSLEKSGESVQAFLDGIKKERVEFERHTAEEEKAFLLYLKSTGLEEREAAFKQFMEKQAKKRLDADKNFLAKQDAWFQEHVKNNWKSADLDSESAKLPPQAVKATPPAAATAQAPAHAHQKHKRKKPVPAPDDGQ